MIELINLILNFFSKIIICGEKIKWYDFFTGHI